jgi:hypothetical protein
MKLLQMRTATTTAWRPQNEERRANEVLLGRMESIRPVGSAAVAADRTWLPD